MPPPHPPCTAPCSACKGGPSREPITATNRLPTTRTHQPTNRLLREVLGVEVQLLEQRDPALGLLVKDVRHGLHQHAAAAQLLQRLDRAVQLLLAHADGGGVEAVLRRAAVAVHVHGRNGGPLQTLQAGRLEQAPRHLLGAVAAHVGDDAVELLSLEVAVKALNELVHHLQQPGPVQQRALVGNQDALAVHDVAALNLLEVVLPQRHASGHEVQDDVGAAHGGRRLQSAVRAQQHHVLEALGRKEALGHVVVAGDHPQGRVLGPVWHVAQLVQGVDGRKLARHGDAQGQLALAKVERLVAHDEVGVTIRQLRKHVGAHNAQVDVAVAQLAHHVAGALEPHLQTRDLGDGCNVLARVGLVH
mmetsp:Transcript_21129/g.53698  ORF Transcript_21129/g.53698 Transcript_21129/m.53698 type:complete len:360 (-) Transcript_21129:376-1455(-)